MVDVFYLASVPTVNISIMLFMLWELSKGLRQNAGGSDNITIFGAHNRNYKS